MYTLQTTIGDGCAIVYCEYTVSDGMDYGDVEIDKLVVMFNGVDITPCLQLEQVEDLYFECSQDFSKQAERHNAEMAISYLEMDL